MNSLPIDDVLPELKQAVIAGPVVVLNAPPGAGKTTRVPLKLLEMLPPGKGRIVMLEPRRIAAVSAARWMARDLGERVGETVGYSIRLDRCVSSATRIEVVTEGILTRRIQDDPGLEGVAMVIFDEFHERSIHADLALALSLDIRRCLREDLKILVMSATLDSGPVASLLGDAPVITSSGRAFPVEERYLYGEQEKSIAGRTAQAIERALAETEGDILAFLPGAGEIRSCAEALEDMTVRRDRAVAVHPLYADLPFEEQEKAILPAKTRKIVLATNVAETSLTIEGVRVVIDSGLTRRLRHDPSTGMNRLVTVSVSRASAEQRKGRAGRLAPGVCYRLYSRHGFQAMVPFSPPEILTSDLSALALDLAVWGVKAPSELSWLDPPPHAAWEAAVGLLAGLGAIDRSGSATDKGKAMARLPLHPRLAGLMLRAAECGRHRLGADLAALLSERDIFRRRSLAGGVSRLSSKETDLVERLETLYSWRRQEKAGGMSDERAIFAVDRAAGQLVRLVQAAKKVPAEAVVDHDMVSRLLVSAFPDRIAARCHDSRESFILSHGRRVRLPAGTKIGSSPYIVAVNVDAGEGAEGAVHLAAALTEELLRRECAAGIETGRRLEWDRRESRVVAALEERLGAIVLSSKPFNPPDEEVARLLCDAIRLEPGMLSFGREARQFQGRVALMRRTFPGEAWSDCSDEGLLAAPEDWLAPWLCGLRSRRELQGIELLPALRSLLSREQVRRLDELAPEFLSVPSGRRAVIDYASGDIPVLAVKLQEMFGLRDTPEIANGRVRVLLHLLSPAGRPVQITQDLKGFWNNGYLQVRKELRGRYPKHPWPDDPCSAVPTRGAKPRKR